MKNLNFSSYFTVFAAAALLTACGGSRAGAPGAQTLPAAHLNGRTAATSGELLYIAHRGVSQHMYHSVVSILTYPGGQPVARITNVIAQGICSDTLGNVWVIVYLSGRWKLFEYAHGGTTPIAELDIGKNAYSEGCAVDPASGDLAVASEKGWPYNGEIDIWPGARSGKPAVYKSDFVPLYVTYDDHSNLFVAGVPGGSDFWLELGYLMKGSQGVTRVRFDRRAGSPGAIQWDGKHVAVETTKFDNSGVPRIYRLAFSGTNARVVGTTIPRDPQMYYQTLFCLEGNQIISMAGSAGNRVEVWPYPESGMHTQYIGRFDRIEGMAISPAPAP